jgi:hypothetical protein
MWPARLWPSDLNGIRGRQQVVFHVIGQRLKLGIEFVMKDDSPDACARMLFAQNITLEIYHSKVI